MLDDKKWLEELKPGDQVIVHRYGFGHSYELGVVVSITAKRRDITIELSKNGYKQKFDSRGYDRGYGIGSGSSLMPVTDENLQLMKENILKRNASYIICELRDAVQKLSLEDLSKVYTVIRDTDWYKERQQKQGETNVQNQNN